MVDLQDRALRRKLVKSNDYILREKTIPFDFPFDFENPSVEPVYLRDLMVYNMMSHGGVGLAAPQIGLPYSVFALGNPNDESSIMVMFNPIIVNYSDDVVKMEEGCLSFPNLFLKIKRPTAIRIRYADYTGKIETVKMEGATARIAQHEYDHLLGNLYTNRANSTDLDRAKRRQKNMNRK